MLQRLLVELALPIACAWVRREEARILHHGRPLSESALGDARAIGVQQPERIRIEEVSTIPPRLSPVLRRLAPKFGLTLSGTIGMALQHGIFIRKDSLGDRPLLVHELTHVAQYERLGLRKFLRQYLHECLSLGYPLGALEAEAREMATTLCS